MDFSIPRCKRRSFRFHEIFNTIECAEEFPSFTNEKKLLPYSGFLFAIAIFKIFSFLSFYAVSEKKKKLFHFEKESKRKGGKRIVCETQEASRIRLLSITARFYRGMRSLCRLSPCNVLHRHLFGQHPLAPCLPSSPVCFSPLRATVILLN